MSTCIFGAGELSCPPIPMPTCPYVDGARLALRIAPEKQNDSLCTADVTVRLEPAATAGGTRVLWNAQELENAPTGGCRPLGPEREGETVINAACCERIVDVTLPNAGRTFRMVVKTDWVLP